MAVQGLEAIAGEAVPFPEAMERLGLPKASVTGLIAAGILETVEHEGGRGIPASSIDGFVRLMEGKAYVFTLQHEVNRERNISLSAMSNVVYKYGQLLKDAGLIEYLGESASHYTIVYPLSRETELQAVLAHGISALGCTEEEAASICARFGLNEFHRKVLVSSGISLKDFNATGDGRKVLNPAHLQEHYGISPDSFYHRFPRRVGSLLAGGFLVMVGEAGLNRHFFMYDSGAEELVVAALLKRYGSHRSGSNGRNAANAAASTNDNTALAAGQGLEARVGETRVDGVGTPIPTGMMVGTREKPKPYSYVDGFTPSDYRVGEWLRTAAGAVGLITGKRPVESSWQYESIITVMLLPHNVSVGAPTELKEFVVNPKRADAAL